MKKITVVMSIYKPKKEWLQSQLVSINNQTYKNIILLVWNDCPNDNFDYEKYIKEYIIDIPFKYYIGEKNYGSNKAFELLTKKTNTNYIAYCDQDDIWELNKLEILMRKLNEKKGDLIYSNMKVIDAKNKIIANKIECVRPHQKAYIGNNIVKELFKRNFITGCTILMKTDMAKKACPFLNNIVHDHWLGIYTAINGKIVYEESSLINYRIHSEQQTGPLAKIDSKDDYYHKKILLSCNRYKEIKNRIEVYYNKYINSFYKWSICRKYYYENPNILNGIILLLKCYVDIKTTIFELILPIISDKSYKNIVKHIRKGNF